MATRLVLLAHGQFSPLGSKTANCVIRYRQRDVVAVLDRDRAGETAQSVLGFGGAIPVVGRLGDCAEAKPTELLIGIAPPGGGLPPAWREDIREAIGLGMDVSSGLHVFLADDREIAASARARGVQIRDLRKPPEDPRLPTGALKTAPFKILLTVGTDCNAGKMTAAWEIAAAMRRLGRKAAFAATGQTGIFLGGRGIAVDRVISDFVAGATETLIVEVARADDAEIVVVEGQGSLSHPAYSGVTLSLLHGAMPHAMVLCHHVGRRDHAHYDGFPLPPIEESIEAYERLAAFVRPARVVGVAANGIGLTPSDFERHCRDLEEVLEIPIADPVSGIGGGADALARAALHALDAACGHGDGTST
ncbi:MAG: DUF1611 domain-containing protein [Acidobacteriota bacterium]